MFTLMEKHGNFPCCIDACRENLWQNMEDSESMHRKFLENIHATCKIYQDFEEVSEIL